MFFKYALVLHIKYTTMKRSKTNIQYLQCFLNTIHNSISVYMFRLFRYVLFSDKFNNQWIYCVLSHASFHVFLWTVVTIISQRTRELFIYWKWPKSFFSENVIYVLFERQRRYVCMPHHMGTPVCYVHGPIFWPLACIFQVVVDGEVVVVVEDAQAVVEVEDGDEGVVKQHTFKHLMHIVTFIISSCTCTYITRSYSLKGLLPTAFAISYFCGGGP